MSHECFLSSLFLNAPSPAILIQTFIPHHFTSGLLQQGRSPCLWFLLSLLSMWIPGLPLLGVYHSQWNPKAKLFCLTFRAFLNRPQPLMTILTPLFSPPAPIKPFLLAQSTSCPPSLCLSLPLLSKPQFKALFPRQLASHPIPQWSPHLARRLKTVSCRLLLYLLEFLGHYWAEGRH